MSFFDLPTAYYPFGIFQTFITNGHCVVDLTTAYYPFDIFQTFITNGHCVVNLHTLQTCSNVVDSNFATTSPPLSLLSVPYGYLVLLVSTVSFLFLIFVYTVDM
jgi:hypothetical protein